MELVTAPALAPGACALTGSDVGPFIDTLIETDDLPPRGRVYIGMGAIETMAALVGWVPGFRIADLTERNETLTNALAETRAQLAAAHQSIASLKEAGYSEEENVAQRDHRPPWQQRREQELAILAAAAEQDGVVVDGTDEPEVEATAPATPIIPDGCNSIDALEAWVNDGADDDEKAARKATVIAAEDKAPKPRKSLYTRLA